MVGCFNRNKKIVRVENPQYKASGYGDEQVTLGLGPTVSFAYISVSFIRWFIGQ